MNLTRDSVFVPTIQSTSNDSFEHLRNRISSYSFCTSAGFSKSKKSENMLTQLYLDSKFYSNPRKIISHPNFILLQASGSDVAPELIEKIGAFPFICCLLLEKIFASSGISLSSGKDITTISNDWLSWYKLNYDAR